MTTVHPHTDLHAFQLSQFHPDPVEIHTCSNLPFLFRYRLEVKRSAEQLRRHLTETHNFSNIVCFLEIFNEDCVPLGLSVFILGTRVDV